MGNREIKFDYICRNIHFNEISHVEVTLDALWECPHPLPSWIFSDNCEILARRQFIGLRDKNGVEVYFQDLLDIKFQVWDGEGQYHALYEVIDGFGGGFELQMRKLFEPDEAYFNVRLGAEDIREDYVNQQYDRLAIMDRWDKRRTNMGNKTVHERFYTNDITVVGNVYSNPELLDPVALSTTTETASETPNEVK